MDMDRLLAPKTDEEQVSNMQGDDTDVLVAAPNQASVSWCRGPPPPPRLGRGHAGLSLAHPQPPQRPLQLKRALPAARWGRRGRQLARSIEGRPPYMLH